MIVLHMHFKDNNLVFNNNYIFKKRMSPIFKANVCCQLHTSYDVKTIVNVLKQP